MKTSWTRYEPTELSGKAEHVWEFQGERSSRKRLPRRPTRTRTSEYQKIASDIHQENDGLRREGSTLEATMSSGGQEKTLRAAMQEIQRLVASLSTSLEKLEGLISEEAASAPLSEAKPEVTGTNTPAQGERETRSVANGSAETREDFIEVIASYLWEEPQEPQLRLLTDALRGRGFASKPEGQESKESERPASSQKPEEAGNGPRQDSGPTPETSGGIAVMCASCKRLRDKEGAWTPVEQLLAARWNVAFSHTICPQCKEELYPKVR